MITGSKLYITNSMQADCLYLLARTSEEVDHAGMSQIIVPPRCPASMSRGSWTSWACVCLTPVSRPHAERFDGGQTRSCSASWRGWMATWPDQAGL